MSLSRSVTVGLGIWRGHMFYEGLLASLPRIVGMVLCGGGNL